ncbi:hypothetical protein A1O3_04894 [Capronia epimyces CBS 606.96]|uniref:Phenazine biosynthesis protein n=1 Tax=Capronia epimyces CBS 606.96 TaxID=1182542 RepID=W9XUH6_9EURO|nr:uncharacterized protein A1O3_04894 [Capronia epimyces CBS 606.96]EXJ84227.1 hypothetical protein A1O3_04894 [Capronia epimyces CBS 606.96]
MATDTSGTEIPGTQGRPGTPTQLSYVTLDVFTSTRYTGNPLAIIRVPQHVVLSQSQKQRIAREFNLSESVFLHEQMQHDRHDQSVRIDIFTAYAEVPFAGHPTVGTANYLLRLLQDDGLNGVKALQVKAGRFGISLNPAVSGVQISVAHDLHIHASPFADTPFAHHPVVSIVKGMTFILAQLPDLHSLAAQSHNLVGADATYTAKDGLDQGWRDGIVVSYFYVDLGTTTTTTTATTTPSDADRKGHQDVPVRSLRTRSLGSREDPATGSAASALTSYLALQEGKPGRYRYVLTQGVEMGQRSQIFVEVGVKSRDDGPGVEIAQVLLSGSAVQVTKGSLEVPPA